jgi:hypothetical protein
MILNKKEGKTFIPHPETDTPIRGVIVDVTPPKEMSSQFGTREVFKLVIESEWVDKDNDNRPFCVWSRPYTPSLHEKSNFRKDLKRILGRDLTPEEEEQFDTETLLGLPVSMMIEHTTTDGTTYANIGFLAPYKGSNPLSPSGKFVRAKDREQKDGASSAYKRMPAEEKNDADADLEPGRADWMKVKVHIGKHAGVDLGDLDEGAVQKLIENWLPGFKSLYKPSAADKRLAAALEQVIELMQTAAASAEGDY